MPLIKSKKAFAKNVESEMEAGKPQKQALAIAYSTSRRAKKKKMSQGGELDARDEMLSGIDHEYDHRGEMMEDSHPLMHAAEKRAGTKMVDVDSDDEMELSMVDAIRRKYAKGGEVDLQDSNGDEHLNEEDQLSFDAARKDTYYDLSQLDEQPEDSNEHADKLEDEDSHDMIDSIRKKMKSKLR